MYAALHGLLGCVVFINCGGWRLAAARSAGDQLPVTELNHLSSFAGCGQLPPSTHCLLISIPCAQKGWKATCTYVVRSRRHSQHEHFPLGRDRWTRLLAGSTAIPKRAAVRRPCRSAAPREQTCRARLDARRSSTCRVPFFCLSTDARRTTHACMSTDSSRTNASE